MKATNVLTEEHRVIERVLNSLETGAERLASGQPMRPEFFLLATDFIRHSSSYKPPALAGGS